jgi:hypothetical protein
LASGTGDRRAGNTLVAQMLLPTLREPCALPAPSAAAAP